MSGPVAQPESVARGGPAGWCAVATLAGAVGGLGECLWTASEASVEVATADILLMAGALVPLFACVAMVAAAMLWCLGRLVAFALPGLARQASRFVRWLPGRAPDAAGVGALWAGVLAASAGLVVAIAAVEAAADRYQDHRLLAVVVVAEVLVVAAAATIGYGAGRRTLGGMLRRIAGSRSSMPLVAPRTSLYALLGGVVVGGVLAYVATAALRTAVDVNWAVSVASVASLTWAGHRWRALWLRGGKAVESVLFVAGGCGGIFALLWFPPSQQVALLVHTSTPVAKWLIKGVIAASDVDGDGHGVVLGATDCAPWAPAIHPEAIEVPDDGIDQDCSGADLLAADVVQWAPGWTQRGVAGRNIVIITVDALRRDHIGAYGEPAGQLSEKSLTPNIDRFFAQSTRFAHGYSSSARSVPAFGALFTGRFPSAIQWGDETPIGAFLPENTALAEVLAEAGYQTAAFIATGYFHRCKHFLQGFEYREMQPHQVRKSDSVALVTSALEWLQHRDESRPYFLWVHLADTHAPYETHESFDFGSSPEERYRSEVAYADRALRPLLVRMQDARNRRETVVFFGSDHGEEFGEHGAYHHGHTAHEAGIAVPFALRVPSAKPGVIEAPVSFVDLAPTLLDLVGLRMERPLAGRALTDSLLDGSAPEPRPLFVELIPYVHLPKRVRAVLWDGWKLVHDVRLNVWTLHDLRTDPGERSNRFDSERETAHAMQQRMQSAVDWIGVHSTPQPR